MQARAMTQRYNLAAMGWQPQWTIPFLPNPFARMHATQEIEPVKAQPIVQRHGARVRSSYVMDEDKADWDMASQFLEVDNGLAPWSFSAIMSGGANHLHWGIAVSMVR